MSQGTAPDANGGMRFIAPRPVMTLGQVAAMDSTTDGHTFAFEAAPGGENRIRLVWDGVRGRDIEGPFLQRDQRPYVWSPDHRRIAWYGAADGASFVGIDDRLEGPYEGWSRSTPPTFSPDGRRYAYGVKTADGFHLVIDGQLHPGPRLGPATPVFSPDGARLAWVELERQITEEELARAKGVGPRQRVVIDDEPGPWVANVADLPGACRFSPDAKRVLWAAHDASGTIL